MAKPATVLALTEEARSAAPHLHLLQDMVSDMAQQCVKHRNCRRKGVVVGAPHIFVGEHVLSTADNSEGSFAKFLPYCVRSDLRDRTASTKPKRPSPA